MTTEILPTLVVTFGLIGGLMAAMAVGVIFSNRRLHGSCGGPGGADCVCSKAEQLACEKKHGHHGHAPSSPPLVEPSRLHRGR